MFLFLSIEYWPDPQRGIKEAYRVLKLGGKACLIGPVYPTFWLSRFFADVWMLFPKEEEYIEWFQKAGFKDVQLKRIGPKWYRGVRRHGLIMGCSVTGVKPASGDSPLQVFVILAFLLYFCRFSPCFMLTQTRGRVRGCFSFLMVSWCAFVRPRTSRLVITTIL
jgi:SAM-dependent methyltransferase